MKLVKSIFISIYVLSTIHLSAQAPEKTSKELSFLVNNDTVYGTFLTTVAEKKYKKTRVVLFISGSGPTDRNGNISGAPGPNNSLLLLADSLSDYGISSFRYDKLGIGKSTFNNPEDSMNFNLVVKTAVKAIEMLNEMGFKKIYVMGHSQGSLVGMLAAQNMPVQAFVSLAGPATNAFDLIKEQLTNNMPEGPLQAECITKLDSINQGYTITKYNPMLASLLRPSIQPFLRSYFAYTPTIEIAKLNIPSLIISGERDMQVPISETELLQKAANNGTIITYPKMNHVLKDVNDTEEQNLASYTDPDFPLTQALAHDIASWIISN